MHRGFHHGVLAADVVRAHRNVERFAYAPDHVEIRKRRFNHHHVGAFLQIQPHFLQRLAGIGGIHLIAAAVAELGRRLRRLAKRAVEPGTVLRGVRKNGDVFELVFVEHLSNRADTAIHHIRGRDDISAGARVRKRLLRQDSQRRVIRHFSVLHDAAVAMIGVFAQADVGDDEQFQVGLSNALDGALHNALRAERTCSARVLRFWQAKKNDRRNPERFHLPALLQDLVGGLLENVRHRADFLTHVLPRADKHRIDQACGREARLANHAAKRFRAPQTPRPMRGKTHARFTPAGAAFETAKCFSRASITDAAVVSEATTMRSTPDSTRAFAVTGPTAVMATSFCSSRNERRFTLCITA